MDCIKNKFIVLILCIILLSFSNCKTDVKDDDTDSNIEIKSENLSNYKSQNDSIPIVIEIDSLSNTNKPVNTVTLQNDTISFLKTVMKIKLAAKEKNLSVFNKYIHQKFGCYYIYRPGSGLFYKHILNFTSDWEVQSYGINDIFKTIEEKNVKVEKWPDFTDCGYDGFSKEGAFAKSISNYSYLTELNNFHKKEFDLNISNKELENLKKIESSVKFSVIWTNPSLVIDFVLMNNKWYIGIINIGRFDCSA